MSSATAPIRATVGRAASGTAISGHAQPGDLGDVHREVAHPLQLADHPQRGHHDPEVAGDRLLEGEQGERRLLDPLARPVDLVVGGDDLLGHLGVAVEQRLGGEADRGLDLAADLRQVLEDRVELVVEGFAHVATVGGEGDQQGRDGERLVNTGRARLAGERPGDRLRTIQA